MAGKQFSVEKFMGTLKPVSDSDTSSEVRRISLDRIDTNPLNFYPPIDAAAVAELMDSIQANGLLEPLAVLADGSRYRLVSGHNRLMALRCLRDRLGDAFPADVLCRVLPPMTQDQEVSAIIEANRQRHKSAVLLAQEVERLTESYIKRREAGEDLPGRIRDRVAEALQVSRTKLANISAIKNGVKVPDILRSWERGDIPEAAALEIARLDQEAQYRLLDWVIHKHRRYTISEVRMFRTIWLGCRHDCPDHGGLCPNAEAMYRAFYRGGEWNCAGCCRSCLKRDTCPQSCCKPVKPLGIEQPPAKTPENPGTKDPRLDTVVETFCRRTRELRAQTGLAKKEFAESIGEYAGTYSAWENASLPGSYSVPKLALCLGTTTDYLYGLTDDPAPRGGPVWQPLDREHWPRERQLVLLSGETTLGERTYVAAWCVGGADDSYPFEEAECGTDLAEPSHGEYGGFWWLPLREKEDGGDAEIHD